MQCIEQKTSDTIFEADARILQQPINVYINTYFIQIN